MIINFNTQMLSDACNESLLSCAHNNTDWTVSNDCIFAGVGSMIIVFKVARRVTLDQNGHGKTLHADPPTHRNMLDCAIHTAALCSTRQVEAAAQSVRMQAGGVGRWNGERFVGISGQHSMSR